MTHGSRTILIEPLAPRKPRLGQVCNGCGICCLAEPCPLGIVLSGRRHGACEALRWNEAASVYRCGAVAQPVSVLERALPVRLRRLAPVLAPVLAAVARRMIAVNAGCDSALEASGAAPERET